MNARVDPPPAREVGPTTRRLVSEGALLVDVRERAEIDRLALDVPDIVALPMGSTARLDHGHVAGRPHAHPV